MKKKEILYLYSAVSPKPRDSKRCELAWLQEFIEHCALAQITPLPIILPRARQIAPLFNVPCERRGTTLMRSTQNPHRTGRDLNPGPLAWEARTLPIAPLSP